jgi:hypothetical protein
MSVESNKPKYEYPGACVWCGCLFVKSPLCSEACAAAWKTISEDDETVEDRALLEAMAPSYVYWCDSPKPSTPLQKAASELFQQEELGMETPYGRYRKSIRKVLDRAEKLFGLIPPHTLDVPPLYAKSKMRPVDVRADNKARPSFEDGEGDWSWPVQSGYTDDPELRVIHGLLHLRGQFGLMYNNLLENGRLTQWDFEWLEGAIRDLKWIAEDAKGLVIEEREAA